MYQEVEEVSYQDEEKKVMGCKHYAVGCKIKGECCGNFVTCRFCHDKKYSHEIDRFATKIMKCMFCFTVQNIAQTCANCQKVLGVYYCEKCKFHCSTEGKEIYHCDECGLCRVGLKENFFHCKTCDACLNNSIKDSHPCRESKLKQNCPICLEYLHTSRKPVFFLKCSHPIHEHCLRELSKTGYKCPLCSKFIYDDDAAIRLQSHFDNLIGSQPMPIYFEKTTAKVLCNDCSVESVVSYHYLGHKCGKCGNYNTRILSTENMPKFNELGIVLPNSPAHSPSDDNNNNNNNSNNNNNNNNESGSNNNNNN